VFAQQGALHPPTTIIQIRDRNNRVVYSREDNGPAETHPMTPAEAYLTHWILQGNTDPRQNVLWGTRAQLTDPAGNRREAGFKTGTTNDFKDVSGFGYVPGSLVTGVWMGNSNGDPMSNVLGQGLFSADGPLYLWHDFMQIALNQPWDWNGQQPVPQTTFAQPDGITVARVCRFSGMAATSDCGPTRDIPFLDGTVPPPDNVHSKGCFDIEQEVAQDDRRPSEWVTSAHDWADRFVNGELGSVGDATKLRENPTYHLAIAPVLGNNGFGAPICGIVRATPTPVETPLPSGQTPNPSGGGGDRCPPGHPEKCSPLPTIVNGAVTNGGALGRSTSVEPAIVSSLALVGLMWGIPWAARALRRGHGARRGRGGGRPRA
jgi:membrane peptidoglycan carboxypeptidase